MPILKRLCSPLGGLAALFALWLPWVHLECNATKVDPNLWQLAEQQGELYLYAAVGLLLLLVALGMALMRHRAWSLGTALVACLGLAAWAYLWLRKDELVDRQTAVEGLSGALGAWMQKLTITPAAGYYLYLTGMLLGLAGAIWYLASPARSPVPDVLQRQAGRGHGSPQEG
jgi:hypothetical protein